MYQLFVFGLQAQISYTQKTREEIKFINHLIQNRQFEDANYLLEKIDLKKIKELNLVDSISFLKGWAYYNEKQLDSSAKYLLKVTESSSLYEKSIFFSAYNYSYQRNYKKSRTLLNQPNNFIDKNRFEKLKNLQLAGLALLERDYEAFNTYSDGFSFDYYATSKQETSLVELSKISKKKRKSYFLAGLMSSVIPGSGKIYAGKAGEGTAAFLAVGSMFALTVENYLKDGFNDFKTLIFASVFTVFYIGNIYGSIVTIKVQNERFNEQIDTKILFDMHIPLRTIFN